ncbi:MAG: hypothetical protein RIM84_18165 [Alphaproteobacteria bacterium]
MNAVRLGVLSLALMFAATTAAAQSCDRLRVTSHAGDTQLQGIYDFCNEYRQLQAEVRRLTQQLQTLEQAQRTAQRRQQIGGDAVPVAEVIRDGNRATHDFAVGRDAVLLATAYGAGRVSVSLDGASCVAASGSATCQRPLAAGKHSVTADGRDVVLSVVVVVR